MYDLGIGHDSLFITRDNLRDVVSLLEAAIIGVLQGVLEWLPVSSEGNITLFLVSVLGLDPSETLGLAVFLHLGTGLAALVYYRKESWDIFIGATERDKDMRLRLLVMTVFTGVVGLPIYAYLNVSAAVGEALLALTGLALITTGLMQRRGNVAGERDASSLSWPETVALGVLQGLAIIPGLSRSGVTTSTMLLRGLRSDEAFNVSFIMSIPASFAAGLGLMLIDGFHVTAGAVGAVVVSAGVGYITIGALIGFAQKTSFWKICVGLGSLALLAWAPNLLF
jgi:undecaprenyl-diphosphatase